MVSDGWFGSVEAPVGADRDHGRDRGLGAAAGFDENDLGVDHASCEGGFDAATIALASTMRCPSRRRSGLWCRRGRRSADERLGRPFVRDLSSAANDTGVICHTASVS